MCRNGSICYCGCLGIFQEKWGKPWHMTELAWGFFANINMLISALSCYSFNGRQTDTVLYVTDVCLGSKVSTLQFLTSQFIAGGFRYTFVILQYAIQIHASNPCWWLCRQLHTVGCGFSFWLYRMSDRGAKYTNTELSVWSADTHLKCFTKGIADIWHSLCTSVFVVSTFNQCPL
jgi:hypothetical protein